MIAIAAPPPPARIPNDPGFAPRFEDLRAECSNGSAHAAYDRLRVLHCDVDRFVEGAKRSLFRAPLALSDEQKDASRWILAQHQAMARHAVRVAEALANDPGADPRQLVQATALALHHIAEAMKSEMSGGPREPHHFPTIHALMQRARDRGFEHEQITLQVQAVDTACTVESLYFRTLLLARIGGVLSPQQIEIMDAWFWMWMPALHGTRDCPDGPWLRVDLDSRSGLRRAPEAGGTRLLYLPLMPLERAHRAIVQRFQNGEIVPTQGHASRFRIEEHMVVLDMARRTLRGIRRAPVMRAARVASNATAQLHVGITEIMSRSFKAAPPPGIPVELVALEGEEPGAPRRERDDPLSTVYEIARREVQVIDVSASGFGLEGSVSDCGEIAVGDIVAMRLSVDGPIELGKVARRARGSDDGHVKIGVQRAPASGKERVVIGVRQISPSVQRVALTPAAGNPARRTEQMLFVPGDDSTGRHDGFLMPDSAPVQGLAFEATVAGQTYSIRLNRVRDRGRGWVLAGFEIFDMRKNDPMKVAQAAA